MFVQNCKVLMGQQVRPLEGDEESGPYHPVLCADCNTHIGVRDREEVYHFFNVIPGMCLASVRAVASPHLHARSRNGRRASRVIARRR